MAATPAETLRITPQAPFEFTQSLAFLRGLILCSGDHACIERTLTTGGSDSPFLARVTEADAETLSVDIEWLRGFLSLDDDLSPLYEAAETDPAFGRVVDAL